MILPGKIRNIDDDVDDHYFVNNFDTDAHSAEAEGNGGGHSSGVSRWTPNYPNCFT